ncbi:hypothetical protein [Luteimonas sp. A478]
MRTHSGKIFYFLSTAMLAMHFSGCTDNPKSSQEIAPVKESLSEPAALPADSDLGDPAFALVNKLNMGSNLEMMAYQVAKSTHTYGLVAQKHGADRAESIVKMEIKEALPQYQKRWDKNLASAYSKHLSADELHSLVTQGASSPYASKFMSVRGAVAADMKNQSTALLNELVITALSKSVSDS